MYIYNGAANFGPKHSQQINDFEEKIVDKIGLSLAGRIDVDNNKHPDLAIGAADKV